MAFTKSQPNCSPMGDFGPSYQMPNDQLACGRKVIIPSVVPGIAESLKHLEARGGPTRH